MFSFFWLFISGKKQSNKNDVYEESSVESPVESDDSEYEFWFFFAHVFIEIDPFVSMMKETISNPAWMTSSLMICLREDQSTLMLMSFDPFRNKKNAEIEDRYDDAYEVEDKKKKRTPTKKATPKRASLKKSKAIKKEDVWFFDFFFRFFRVTKKWILETCIASFHCISLSTRAPVKAKKETKKKTATVLFFLPLNDILGKTSKIRRNSHKTSQEGNNLCSKATQASNRLAALGSSHASIFYSFSIMF